MNQRDYSVPEVLTITFILSFCSIVYELLLANTLGIMTGSYIWWQSITIGVYIGGLGLGSAVAAKKDAPYESLFKAEWILTILGGISVVFIYFLHGGYKSTDFLFFLQNEFHSPAYLQQSAILKFLFFTLVETLTFLIGFFSGFEIPLMMKRLQGKADNQVLGLNYIGTLFGSLAFAFFLLPVFDVLYSSLIIASLNLLVCFYLLMRKRVTVSGVKIVGVGLLTGMLAFLYIKAERIEQNYLKTYYLFKRFAGTPDRSPREFFRQIDRFDDIERLKSPYQYIDIYRPDLFTDEVIMAIDTNFQFSTHNERFYHEGFAHVPLNMVGIQPDRVLVLGGGDGLLIRELLKYDTIKEIIHVELDPMVLEVSKDREFFSNLNRNALKNPRVKTVIEDAFYYLRNNEEKFDAIFIDFPYPNNYNLARLYSVEFYRFVKKSLFSHGFVVLDAPIQNQDRFMPSHIQGQVSVDTIFNESDRTSNSILLSTAYFAGFKQLFPYKVGEESFLLMANLDRAYHYDIDQRDLTRYEVIEPVHLREIMRQDFPHRLREEYINSIFRPRLLSGPTF